MYHRDVLFCTCVLNVQLCVIFHKGLPECSDIHMLYVLAFHTRNSRVAVETDTVESETAETETVETVVYLLGCTDLCYDAVLL